MSKNSRLKGPFDKLHFKGAQAVLKSSSQHLYAIDSSLPSQYTWKKSLLLTCQILGLLVNTFATDEKYPVLNKDTLTIRIQMQLSKKQKVFAQFFAAFSKCKISFEYFEKNDEPHRFCISVITDFENIVTYMPKTSLFREPFNKQLGKRAQALLKTESQHLYHTH